jgi:hypothetical protein
MKSGITSIEANQCLVDLLTQELSRQADVRDFSATWIVLPTHRLATWLTASLLSSHRAPSGLLLPRMMTLDAFLEQLLTPLGLASDGETFDLLEPVMHCLLATGRFRHLDPTHAHEIAHLFGVMTDSNLNPLTIGDSIASILQSEIYRSDDYVCALFERIQSLQAFIHEFSRLLAGKGLRTRELQRAILSAKIAHCIADLTDVTPDNVPPPARTPWDRLIVAGFTSMAPAQIPLMKVLSKRSDVSILLTTPPYPFSEVSTVRQDSPLARLARALGAPERKPSERKPSGLKPHDQGIPTAKMRSILAPDRAAEVDLALDLALEYSRSTPSHRPDVAILLPDESAYEPLFRSAIESRIVRGDFSGKNPPPNLAAAMPLTRTSAGQWVLNMLRFLNLSGQQKGILKREHREIIAEIVRNPLTVEIAFQTISRNRYDAHNETAGTNVTNSPELLTATTALLVKVAANAPNLTAFATMIQKNGKTGDRASDLAWMTWKWLLQETASFRSAKTPELALDYISNQVKRVTEISTSRPWQFSVYSRAALKSSARDPRSEQRQTAESLERCIHSARIAIATINETVTTGISEAADLICREIEKSTIRQTGEPLLGIQILTLAEARHIPFDTAIIVGCNEGVFPRALPRDRLLDQYLLRRLKLPSWEDLEAMEDTTFFLLRARLSNLIMTGSRATGDRPLVPSRYMELAAAITGTKIESFTPVSKSENEAFESAGSVNFSTGRIVVSSRQSKILQQPHSTYSLESLIQCPYRFALERHNTRTAESHDDQMIQRQGTWMHERIALAFDPQWRKKEPLSLGKNLDVVSRSILARLNAATDCEMPDEIAATDLPAHLRVWSWPRLADFTARYWALSPGGQPVEAHSEMSFSANLTPDKDAVIAGSGSLAGDFNGRMDRFENLGNAWLLIDYKRMHVAGPADVASGRTPQLPIYAAAIAQERALSLDSCIAGYFSILAGKWQFSFIGKDARDFAIAAGLMRPRQRPAEPQTGIVNAGRLKVWRETDIRTSGAFIPDQSECGYCPHADICRRDDAAAANWFRNHALSRPLALKLGK